MKKKDAEDMCILELGIKALAGIACQTDEKSHLVAHMCDAIGILMVDYEGKEFKEALDAVVQAIVDKHTEGLRGVDALREAAKKGILPAHKNLEDLTEDELRIAKSVIEEAELPDDSKLTPEQERIADLLYKRIKG